MLEKLVQLTPTNTFNSEQNFKTVEESEIMSEYYVYDLPLWRVQWTQFPGQTEVLNVHVPHYVDMFNRLMEGPQPWYFGHLFLPGGSENLSNPKYELEEGSQAPMVGTLMRISHACNTKYGKLLIIAVGLQRFRVVRKRQSLPYQSADVKLIVDQEELEFFTSITEKYVGQHITKYIEDEQKAVQVKQDIAAEMAVLWNKMFWSFEVKKLWSIPTAAGFYSESKRQRVIEILNEIEDANCLEPYDDNNQEKYLKVIEQSLIYLFKVVKGDPTVTLESLDKQEFDLLSRIQCSVEMPLNSVDTQLSSQKQLEQQLWQSLEKFKETLLQKFSNRFYNVEVYPPALTQLKDYSQNYPSMRRLQRLTYLVALALPDFDVFLEDSAGAGRQKVLEIDNLQQRLKMVRYYMYEREQFLFFLTTDQS
eukprot:TRINITY_DN43899_c0_g1_i1.p1 TRINITY_DN43899_c0_g1~~TRINITY_DN43899_c0_g1_i1.p1  ORF type:complete len:476 (+),score=44.25 TRINITY_DN43899_c0_g1_i1:170-1429(+)